MTHPIESVKLDQLGASTIPNQGTEVGEGEVVEKNVGTRSRRTRRTVGLLLSVSRAIFEILTPLPFNSLIEDLSTFFNITPSSNLGRFTGRTSTQLENCKILSRVENFQQ